MNRERYQRYDCIDRISRASGDEPTMLGDQLLQDWYFLRERG